MKKIVKLLTISLYIFICFIACNIAIIKAETSDHSDVLDDLRQDETFKVEDYLSYTYDEIINLNSDTDDSNDQQLIEVINIAEGTNKELFVYVYNPTYQELFLNCSYITIFSGFSNDGKSFTPILYSLEKVSTSGVFDKYIVKERDDNSNYQVSDEVYRYYNIVSIYRDYNPIVDTNIENGNTNGIAHAVGQQYCFYWYNDEYISEMETFNVVVIDDLYPGNLSLNKGITCGNVFKTEFDYFDAHFIAFNCDQYDIDHIYDADLTYSIQNIESIVDTGKTETTINELSTKEVKSRYLSDIEVVSLEGQGLKACTTSWERISTTENFVSTLESQGVDFSDFRSDLLNRQWIFSFIETERTIDTDIYHEYIMGTNWTFTKTTTTYYDVSEISILRLHFRVGQKTYNLGVVSDLVSDDNIADGYQDGINESLIQEWFEKILMIVGLIALLVILGFCPAILNIIIKIFTFIFNGIITILSLPIKFFKLLFKDEKKPNNRR